MEKETFELFKNLTNKEHIQLVSRGNKAILYALRIAKKLGKTKLFIQDQGGWITYKQFGDKLKLDINIIGTDYGLVNPDRLDVNQDSILLINSLTGYFAQQDMDTIYSKCFSKKCLVINDISGSIGTEAAKAGDILVCSFGEDKPLNYGKGGLIAVENKDFFNLTKIDEEELKDINQKIIDLPQRLFLLKKVSKKIKQDLKDYDIIHKDKEGINVVIKFNSEKEKKELIDYCNKNKYEYTECPRYIRVMTDAISIEVKRLK